MVYLCGKKEKNGGVHAYFLSVCPACCACALRANVTTCREDRHPPGKKFIQLKIIEKKSSFSKIF